VVVRSVNKPKKIKKEVGLATKLEIMKGIEGDSDIKTFVQP
jgi:hypothetical protein